MVKFYCFFILASVSLSVQSQYLCDGEYKVINKQKKRVKKKCKKIAHEWVSHKKDSLNLPKKLKLSKLKFRSEEKETDKNNRYNRWSEIDSLLCIQQKPTPEYIKKAKKRLLELQLVVYDIRTEFSFNNSSNNQIKSVLNFEFDIEGNLIRAVIRNKKMSPFSETPHH